MLIGPSYAVVEGVNALRAAGSTAHVATLSNNASSEFVKSLGENARRRVVTQLFPYERSTASPLVREALGRPGLAGRSELTPAQLAVGSTLQEGADLDAIAAKFVNRNFRTEHDNPIELELVSNEDSITLKGEVTINTYFMPLVGQPYVTVSAESEVRRGGSNVEVALVLDITGSMTTTRMEGLTSAAKILVEEVVNPIQTPFFSKVAIAPWSQSVHVGSTHVNSGVVEDLRGALTGTTPISAANWRNGATTTKTITEAGWRTTAGGKTIANAGTNGSGGIDWRWGPSRNITGFTKVSSNTRIQVTTSANHGYSNGEFVRLTGITTGSYTALNNNIYLVADKTNTTFNLRNVGDTAYITPPAGTTSTTGASQRCHDSVCNMGVTTTSAFTGLAAGDFVNITGTSGFPGSLSPNYINNSATTTWVVAAVPSTTRFTLSNLDPEHAVQHDAQRWRRHGLGMLRL